MQQKLFYEKLKKTKHKLPIIFSWLECAVPRTQSCCSLGCCDLQSIGTCWWLIAVAWIGNTGYWERFWLQLACWCASLASSGLALQHTDRLWAKLGSLVPQPGQLPHLEQARCVPNFSQQWLSLFLLLSTVKGTCIPKPGAQWLAPCSCSQMTMAFKRLSLTPRGVPVLAQTEPAVQQILAAALLLREVIGVGYMLAFSLKCHLWGVIFYFS